MKRHHLIEFNERSECPKFIRDSVVETLGLGLRWVKMGNIIGPPFAEFIIHGACGARYCPPCQPRYAFAVLIARQILFGVIGCVTWRTPRCHNASMTPLLMQAGAPIVPLSPAPLMPSGLLGA